VCEFRAASVITFHVLYLSRQVVSSQKPNYLCFPLPGIPPSKALATQDQYNSFPRAVLTSTVL